MKVELTTVKIQPANLILQHRAGLQCLDKIIIKYIFYRMAEIKRSYAIFSLSYDYFRAIAS